MTNAVGHNLPAEESPTVAADAHATGEWTSMPVPVRTGLKELIVARARAKGLRPGPYARTLLIAALNLEATP